MNEFIAERQPVVSPFSFTLADLCAQADLAYLGGSNRLEWHVDQTEIGVTTFVDPETEYSFSIPSDTKPTHHNDSGYAFHVDGEEYSIEFYTQSVLKL